jgi:hypothetical protein
MVAVEALAVRVGEHRGADCQGGYGEEQFLEHRVPPFRWHPLCSAAARQDTDKVQQV